MTETSKSMNSPYAQVAPAFQGYSTLVKWALSNDGMMVKVALRSHSEVHPFRRYKIGNSGQRMHVAMSRRMPDGSRADLGAWEAMLSWWSDDPRQGMTVGLRLDDGPDGATQHPLEGMQKGDEMYIACWLVDDEDEVVAAPTPASRKKRSWDTLRHAQQAHVLCADRDFQEWSLLQASVLGMDGDMTGNNAAIAVLRARCGIVSRKEFAQDDEHGLEARRHWTSLVTEFREWSSK